MSQKFIISILLVFGISVSAVADEKRPLNCGKVLDISVILTESIEAFDRSFAKFTQALKKEVSQKSNSEIFDYLNEWTRLVMDSEFRYYPGLSGSNEEPSSIVQLADSFVTHVTSEGMDHITNIIFNLISPMSLAIDMNRLYAKPEKIEMILERLELFAHLEIFKRRLNQGEWDIFSSDEKASTYRALVEGAGRKNLILNSRWANLSFQNFKAEQK